MQFGVCGGPDIGKIASEAGFDYIEDSVAGLLKPMEEQAAFEEQLEKSKGSQLPCPVVNCFLPKEIKITGPVIDEQVLYSYVETVFVRAEQAGLDTIVFGSGGSRRVPDDFDHERAWSQIVDFCKKIGPMASDHGVRIAIEPLNQNECNILTSVGECADLAREADHPAIRLLVDAYHFLQDDLDYEAIRSNGDILIHAHIATVPNRLPPGAEQTDFEPFFAALKDAGYSGRLSFEGRREELEARLPEAIKLLKNLS